MKKQKTIIDKNIGRLKFRLIELKNKGDKRFRFSVYDLKNLRNLLFMLTFNEVAEIYKIFHNNNIFSSIKKTNETKTQLSQDISDN